MENRKLRMGMVGGGSDAFIGAIHRRAAFMENQIELVCGCFSVNPEISRSSGRSYFCLMTESMTLMPKCLNVKQRCQKVKEWIS